MKKEFAKIIGFFFLKKFMEKQVGEEVEIVPSIGKWVSVKDVPYPVPADQKNSYDVKAKFGSWHPFEGSDQVFVQHAMPCVTPNFPIPEGEDVVGLPMKGENSPYKEGVKIVGKRSGRRSAIIPASYEKMEGVDWIIGYDPEMKPLYPNSENPQFLLRLKGCGMWLKSTPFDFPGITIQPLPSVHFPDIETVEIRGTAFPATVSNEMYTTQEIIKMMDILGLRHMNEPMGFWMYGKLKDGMDPCPTIPKSCSIFKTIGDRRLESHLLQGLERMILHEMTAEEAQIAYDRICELYTKDGWKPPSDENRAYSRLNLIWKFAVNNFIAKHQHSVEGGDIKNLTKNDIYLRGILPSSQTYKVLEGLTIKGLPLSDLAKTFGRLAWECGRIISCVHRAGFNWGSYKDHSANGELDNAHADNIALIPHSMSDLGNGRYQVLSGLDFDMSFRKEQTVNIWGENPVPDPLLVTQYWSIEFGNMWLNLTGYTAALEGVAKGVIPRDPKEVTPNMQLIWAMRFLAIWEYPQGYQYPGNASFDENDITLERIIPFLDYAIDATKDVPS